ncbi:MAG: DUF1257 domain-containing protein [Microcoleus sp.]
MNSGSQVERIRFGFSPQRGVCQKLVAVFWGDRINQQEFINLISQKSARKSLIAAWYSEGFNVEEEETLADGTVRVVVGWWV